MIKASMSEFIQVTNKVCFFHFAKCIWRKIQSSDLASIYEEGKMFSSKMLQLSVIVFLPLAEISAAFDEMKQFDENKACRSQQVIKWFKSNYVYGKMRKFCVAFQFALLYYFLLNYGLFIIAIKGVSSSTK